MHLTPLAPGTANSVHKFVEHPVKLLEIFRYLGNMLLYLNQVVSLSSRAKRGDLPKIKCLREIATSLRSSQ